jgi:hypothetical protein
VKEAIVVLQTKSLVGLLVATLFRTMTFGAEGYINESGRQVPVPYDANVVVAGPVKAVNPLKSDEAGSYPAIWISRKLPGSPRNSRFGSRRWSRSGTVWRNWL